MTRRGINFSPSEDAEADEVVTAQAAAWYALFLSGEANKDDESRFRMWLRAGPKRESVYAELVKTWEHVDALAPVFKNDVLKVGPATKSAPAAPLFAEAAGSARFGVMARFSAAILAATVFVFATFAYYQSPTYQVTITSRHEPVVEALVDGSSIQLNASTEVEVSFTRSERRLELISGQAFFDVAKNSSRPFVVTAGDKKIIAVGTAFDVMKKHNGVTVTLHEGVVDVASTIGVSEAVATIRLAPGEQLGYERGFPSVVQTVEPERVSAWRRGRIELHNVSLGDAVEQINLYSDRRLVLIDDDLRDVHLNFSGPLGPKTVDAFLSAIEIKYSVTAITSVSQDAVVYLKRDTSKKIN